MFIGHFAVGFAAKRWAPSASLGTLLLAPLFLDALWPLFLALGIESVRIDPGNTAMTPLDLHDYPYTHSLLMAVVWSAAFALVSFARRRDTTVASVLALGVFSHWLLDFVTHRPDMPLYPGSTTYVGLGLWNSVPATVIVESAMIVAGVALYARATRPPPGKVPLALWVYLAVLAALYVSAVLSPPPPSARAVMIVGFVSWIFVPWAAWVDRRRTAGAAAASPA